MDDLSRLSNTLGTQSTMMADQMQGNVSSLDPTLQNVNQQMNAQETQIEERPAKRGPGRPKGSGKMPVDPNQPPKVKRPVGRPRKDGLPAGSAPGAKRPERSRKRSPGIFATGSGTVPIQPVSAPGTFGGLYPPTVWPTSVSSAPTRSARESPQSFFPIDPSLEQDDWAKLARTKPNSFLRVLVTALNAPNPIPRAGPTVEEAFKSHLVSLAPTQNKSQTTIPSLYSILKTFWLPSSPAYFSMTASASTARTPPEHRFLYWDPQPLVFNGIACPHCSCALANRGRIKSGPIKVYDLGKPFFIIGCEYACTSEPCVAAAGPEGRKFSSTDVSIIRSLPTILSDEFPAHLLQGPSDLGSGPNVWNWQAMGVSKTLWTMVRAGLMSGMRKEAILNVIKCIQFGVPETIAAPPETQEDEEGTEHAPEGQGGEGDEREVAQGVQQGQGPNDTGVDGQGMQKGDNGTNTESGNAFNGAWSANDASGNAGEGTENDAGPSADPTSTNQATSSSSAYAFAPPQVPGPYVAYPYGAYPYFQSQPGIIQHTFPASGATSTNGGLKRALDDDDTGSEPSANKRTRHCCKCGSPDCKGKGGRAFCTNHCQDCGKLECKGRNSKRPDKTCADAWP